MIAWLVYVLQAICKTRETNQKKKGATTADTFVQNTENEDKALATHKLRNRGGEHTDSDTLEKSVK